MRRLAFALAGATLLAAAVPASAQTFYVDNGYRSGYGGWGYSDWGYRDRRGARAEVYVGAPSRRAYSYESAPRYSYRSRDWDDGYYSAYAYSSPRYSYGYRDDGYSAYAYSGPSVGYRSYRGWGGPYVGVGVGWGW